MRTSAPLEYREGARPGQAGRRVGAAEAGKLARYPFAHLPRSEETHKERLLRARFFRITWHIGLLRE